MTYPEHISSLIEDFTFLDDWEERYAHVIALGKALPPLPAQEHNEATKVRGCASQVWLVSEAQPGPDPVMQFKGDSDAHIVKGLVAIAVHIYSGQRASAVKSLDASAIFEALGLSEHLSSQRANGLRAMVERIQRDAGFALGAG